MLNRQLDQKERPTNKLAFMKLDWRRRFGASRIIVRLRRVSIEHRTLRSLPRLIRHTSRRDRLEGKKSRFTMLFRGVKYLFVTLESILYLCVGYSVSTSSIIQVGEMDRPCP